MAIISVETGKLRNTGEELANYTEQLSLKADSLRLISRRLENTGYRGNALDQLRRQLNELLGLISQLQKLAGRFLWLAKYYDDTDNTGDWDNPIGIPGIGPGHNHNKPGIPILPIIITSPGLFPNTKPGGGIIPILPLPLPGGGHIWPHDRYSPGYTLLNSNGKTANDNNWLCPTPRDVLENDGKLVKDTLTQGWNWLSDKAALLAQLAATAVQNIQQTIATGVTSAGNFFTTLFESITNAPSVAVLIGAGIAQVGGGFLGVGSTLLDMAGRLGKEFQKHCLKRNDAAFRIATQGLKAIEVIQQQAARYLISMPDNAFNMGAILINTPFENWLMPLKHLQFQVLRPQFFQYLTANTLLASLESLYRSVAAYLNWFPTLPGIGIGIGIGIIPICQPPIVPTPPIIPVPIVPVTPPPIITPTPVAPPPVIPPTPVAPTNPIGIGALHYGVDSPAINPGTGNSNWYFWCLGWVNNATKSAGGHVSELQVGTAKEAYNAALKNGKIQIGNPPPGAIVFFPDYAPPYGHVGIMNEDGKTYRGTVPPKENPSTIGDRPVNNMSSIPWMMPY